MPTREIYWNVEYARLLIYPVFAVLVAVASYGLYGRLRLWRLGQAERRGDALWARLRATLGPVLAHTGLLRERYPGVAHFLLFWGFAFLTLGTLLIMLQEDLTAPLFGERFLAGDFYLAYSFVLDVAGLAGILAVLLFAYLRCKWRHPGVQNHREDLAILLLLFLVLVGGFLEEAARIAVTLPSFEVWSPVGWALAQGLLAAGVDKGALLALHGANWWLHLLLAFGFLGLVGYTKLLHLLTAPANLFLHSRQPAGALAPIANLEEAETYGVGKVEEFTWKQLLDTDACMRCGRCQDNCPAWNTAKPLSPKKIVLDLRDELTAAGPALLTGAKPESQSPRAGLIGGRIEEEAIWACTTCRACQEHCPVAVEHIPKLVDMRRYLVLSESRFPAELQAPFRNLENAGCPWPVGPQARGAWAGERGLPLWSAVSGAEYLWWVGCNAAADERNGRVAAALARLPRAAGVSFAVLGADESCCGDPARRLGNEYLYQLLAQANVETLHGLGVKKILVHCPHCYNTLKNEYPQFGGNFQVVHTSELLGQLLVEGRLPMKSGDGGTLAYHDPCYLGRHNGLYEEPRRVLAAAGVAVIELRRQRQKSFCCGGGGGRSWLEERTGQRINQARAREVAASGAPAVAVACPYCLSMLTNGLADLGLADPPRVVDVVEVLAERVMSSEK